MAELFISYKSEDRARVKPLVDALIADGLSVWWDAHIGGGDDWRDAIERNLETAACVIVVWSQASIGAGGRFVRDEATRAQRRGAYLPVRIDPVEPPLGFGEIQALPLDGWKSSRKDARYQAVLEAARAMVEGRAAAPVAAAAPAPPKIDRRLILAGGGAAALAAAGAGAFVLWPKKADAQTLAVLPFANLSGDPAQAYFADGLAEELRSSLTLVPAFRVIGRSSSETVRNDEARAAAAKLGVANIVTGSVRRSPDMIRVSAQLINGQDGVERWSQTFDRADGDVLEIQTAIAMNVAEALRVHLAPDDLNVGGTRNEAAHQLAVKGRENYRLDSSASSTRASLELLEQATALDPNYASAWAQRGTMRLILADRETTLAATQAGYLEALGYAKKAIALAPTLPDGHTLMALILQGRLDLAGAESAFRRALQLGPNNSSTLRNCANGLGLLGHAAEMQPYVERAIQLDPLTLTGDMAKGAILFILRRYEEALALARQVSVRAPKRADARKLAAKALILLGREREALTERKALPEDDLFALTWEAVAQARLSDRAASDRILARLLAENGDAAHYQYAQIRAQQKDTALALIELEAAWTFRDAGLGDVFVDPFLDPLRAEPRFKAVMAKLGLKA
ncbi:MAG: hypothetical protein JWP35_1212 [Caulobacter sp.]|nr:hypothetical protein [Caulobacter sp.]